MNATTHKLKPGLRMCLYCSTPFPSMAGQCPSCRMHQAPQIAGKSTLSSEGLLDLTVLMSDVDEGEIERYDIGDLNYCFGGGVAKTGVHLIGGAPGAGKSTKSLQICGTLIANNPGEMLYIAAEETVKEVTGRGRRLQIAPEHMKRLRLLPISALGDIAGILLAMKPRGLIAAVFDSLPGIVADNAEAVTFCTSLKAYAVDLNAPMIVIDHINKQEDFAGLMKLQHAVDATFTLFPARSGNSRRSRIATAPMGAPPFTTWARRA